jgi:membrane fusion protein (multidrug efflux system)
MEPGVEIKKRRTKPFIILGSIAGIGLGSYVTYSYATRNQENTDDAQIEADVVPISARVGGTVISLSVGDNQLVKAGQTILEIDPADLVAKEAQADADERAAHAQADAADAQEKIAAAQTKGGLSSAQAQVSGSAVAVSGADAQIAVAKAAVTRAQTDLKKADTDLKRAQDLRAQDAIPQRDLDNAQATRDSDSAALEQANAQLVAANEARNAAESRVAEAQGHLDSSSSVDAQLAAAKAAADLAHARWDSAKAQLTEAHLQRTYAEVKSPIDGVVSKLAVHEGQTLAPGMMIVAVVPNTTYVVANFKETQVGRMRPNQKATIKIDAFPGKSFEGTVESISAATGARFSLLPPDNASGNFVKVVQRVPVKIKWTSGPSASSLLQAGLSADVTVHVQ